MPRGAKPTCICGSCGKCKRRDYNREYQRRYYRERGLTEEQKQAKREAVKRWREANPERERENTRRYQQTENYLRYQREYRAGLDEEGRQKMRARSRLNYAVRMGRLERGPCEVCGATDTHGHHDDYSKPLDVRWLCSTHHAERHCAEAA